MTISLHTIRKQTLQFQYNGNADGFALQKEVGDWCNFNLIPEIEQQLDLLDMGDNFITIDKLEIEATANKNDWQQKIRDELISCLKQKLMDYKSSDKDEVSSKGITSTRKLDELILYYFENGYLPWWGKALISDDFETVLQNWIREEMSLARADFIRKELKQIDTKTLPERILNQVPQKLFFQLLKNIYKQELEIISHIESFLEEEIANNISATKQKTITKAVCGFVLTMMIENKGIINIDVLIQFLLEEVTKSNVSVKILKSTAIEEIDYVANPIKNAWQQLLNQEIKKELKKEIKGKKRQKFSVDETITTTKLNQEEKENVELSKKENKLRYNKLIDQLTNPYTAKKRNDKLVAELLEGIYIENAGAVIFAAFLPNLFKQLKLEKDGTLKNPNLATLLIQYGVAGSAKIAEYDLALPKILCGIDIEFPVNTNTRIAAGRKKEVDEMLLSLIEYWSVLKDTSIDGLRESFFKRSGKLSLINNEWLLQVEQKPFDMLLEQLPWSISMIKLPWMTSLLKTEWV